jgi:hypothetical protein
VRDGTGNFPLCLKTEGSFCSATILVNGIINQTVQEENWWPLCFQDHGTGQSRNQHSTQELRMNSEIRTHQFSVFRMAK